MRTWFITGASRGFGARIARHALEAGEMVVATARNAQSVVEALGEHENLLALALDVTSEEQAQAAVERFGRIDVLVQQELDAWRELSLSIDFQLV